MMERYTVQGGRAIRGRIRAQGSKNAALALIASCLLTPHPVALLGVPPLTDIHRMLTLLEDLGASVAARPEADDTLTVIVDAGGVPRNDMILPEVRTRRLRSSLFFLGALLARVGAIRMALPDRCAIGARPIDLHQRGFTALGATVWQDHGRIGVRGERLVGTEIPLSRPSVGATLNLMMAATAATGMTTLRNAARDPEVIALASMLNAMGAEVHGAGSGTIRVTGGRALGAATQRVIPDRIEVGTFLIAAAISGGQVIVDGAAPEHLRALMALLRSAGHTPLSGPGWVGLASGGYSRAVDLRTQPYPGFPTDLQNPMLALLLTARGTSIVSESIFEERFSVLPGFVRMGAHVSTHGRVAVVSGVPRLHGAVVRGGDDLRGTAALVLAALGAEGETVIEDTASLRRGYNRFAERLHALGASVISEDGGAPA